MPASVHLKRRRDPPPASMMTVPLLHFTLIHLGLAGRAELSLLQHTLTLDARDAESPSDIATQMQSYSLFVKFHKVAGTTWRSYVDRITGQLEPCSRDCGYPAWDCQEYYPNDEEAFEKCCKVPWQNISCPRPGLAHSCTYHQSLAVIRQAVAGQELTTVAPDMADLGNLWPSSDRLKLLWNVDWARTWLPSDLHNKRILVTTILREPTEKIRSYYYFKNPIASRQGFKSFLEFRRDFVSGNWTQQQFDSQASGKDRGSTSLPILLRSCCEYETWLGNGSVERAKLTLGTQFDLVGITERMEEGLLSLGKLYGLTTEQVATVGRSIPHELDNSDNKLDWTEEERALATFVAQKSTAIYGLAQELFQRQSTALFGSEENLQAAVAAFKALNPDE